MRNLTIAGIGVALLWGLGGCAYHHGDYSGYYAPGYPTATHYYGATYAAYPGYVPYYYPAGFRSYGVFHGPYLDYYRPISYRSKVIHLQRKDHTFKHSDHFFKHPDKTGKKAIHRGHRDHFPVRHSGIDDRKSGFGKTRHQHRGDPGKVIIERQFPSKGTHGVNFEHRQSLRDKQRPHLNRQSGQREQLRSKDRRRVDTPSFTPLRQKSPRSVEFRGSGKPQRNTLRGTVSNDRPSRNSRDVDRGKGMICFGNRC